MESKPSKVEYKKTIFGYTPKWTVFSVLHPATRFSFLFLFNVPFLVVNPYINIFFLLAVILMYRVANVPKMYYGKFLPFGFSLTFFLFLTYAFFPSIFINPPYATPLFSIGPYTYYFENFIVSFAMWVRWMGAIFGTVLIFAITDERDINIALKSIRVPFFLRLAFATGLRSFFSFYYDAMQIIEAQKARGLDLQAMNIFKRLRYYIAVLVPLIMIELKRADEMSDAADSRGYVAFDKDTVVRTEYIGRDIFFTAKDYIVSYGSIGLLLTTIVLGVVPATRGFVKWIPISPQELLSVFGVH